MKIHFSWTISTSLSMQLESEIMIASTKGMNCCHTISVQEAQFNKVDPKLKNFADIVSYKPIPDLSPPWTLTPKWDIEPKGDIVIGVDADVMVWNQKLVIEKAEECLRTKKICGTIGYAEPFPLSEWKRLFEKYNMEENFNYKYNNTKTLSPFYINNGVVMMPSEMLGAFRSSYKKWLLELNKTHKNLYYLCQVANTFAIKECKFPVEAMPDVFNYTEIDNPDLSNLNNVIFLHYNKTREEIRRKGINGITNLKIKKKILRLFDHNLTMI